ncbi:MAG: glucosamine-6-phosphate deaminase [Clostridiales bacterium]|nr:glucosamine-6-phosphate deaminase [Clostridiales bacterium]
MIVQVYENESQIAEVAARLFAEKIKAKPDAVLGFATGSTPLPLYGRLVELCDQGKLDFSTVRTFNLDEYVGIDRSHEQSYYTFMFDNLFSKVNIDPANVRLPEPMPADPNAACAAYDAAIEAAGGIDLQLLGIGHNGHIAFNEPCDFFPDRTHIVELSESTIEANKRFFASADEVPRQAVTMGIGSIMKAREIVMVVTGAGKAEAVAAMINGCVAPSCPASILQFHPATTVLLDKEAAALF